MIRLLATLCALGFWSVSPTSAQWCTELAEVALVDIHPLAPGRTPSTSTARGAPTSTTFRPAGAFMLIEATVDGHPGTYILDSGAPGLILNRRPSAVEESVAAEGLNGSVAFAKTEVASLQWGPLTQTDLTAYAVDLDYLTEALGERIDGMLGYDQLSALPVTIDYRRGSITHHVEDAPAGEGVKLRLRLRGHVAAVRGRIDGRRVELALDTGAGVNVLDDDRLSRLGDDAHERMDDMLLRGLDARQERVPRARVHLTEIADANWIGLPFAFADLSGFAKAGLRVDGVLGKEWLQRHTVTLDYGRGVAYVR